MTYRKCDRCGKDIPHISENYDNAPYTLQYKADFKRPNGQPVWNEADLCHDCADLLTKFLMKWKTDEED